MRRYQLTINGKDVVVDVSDVEADRFLVQVGGAAFDVAVSEESEIVTTRNVEAIRASTVAVSPAETDAAPLIRAPMPGVILSVDVAAGAAVTRGQALLTLEAMKMRNSIRAPRDGVVAAIHITAGQSVGYGDPLVEVAAT